MALKRFFRQLIGLCLAVLLIGTAAFAGLMYLLVCASAVVALRVMCILLCAVSTVALLIACGCGLYGLWCSRREEMT